MAFTAKILSWRFRQLNIVGCLLKGRPTKGGSRAPQDPLLLRIVHLCALYFSVLHVVANAYHDHDLTVTI